MGDEWQGTLNTMSTGNPQPAERVTVVLTERERFLINRAIRFDEFQEDIALTLGPSTYEDLVELQQKFDRRQRR